VSHQPLTPGNRERQLLEGCKLLDPILLPFGFAFELVGAGAGSGGPAAHGFYARDDRRLDLHVRWNLGLVSYTLDGLELSHADFMLGVAAGANAYPGVSDDPQIAFAHLASDLERFGTDFISGSGDEFRRCYREVEGLSGMSGFKRMEERARRQRGESQR